MQWLEGFPADIVRAKGFFWLASRNDMAGLLSQAGPSITLQGAGEWIAALPEVERNEILKDEPELLDRWDKEFGDRMTELVFIGLGMKKEEIASSLDDCLLTDKEMSSDWSMLADRLPAFNSNMMEEVK
ncbi:Zinc-binding GTPase YciC [Cytobacillus firmus]|uniref:Zinc-binding GTPase YciC n=1 Tax=Cytobacillus firmus TaxID=1399 RepID=A0A800MTT6_CYTFI|nr:Zinc-binding GTPase YciC [Cytobacillus firmus]